MLDKFLVFTAVIQSLILGLLLLMIAMFFSENPDNILSLILLYFLTASFGVYYFLKYYIRGFIYASSRDSYYHMKKRK